MVLSSKNSAFFSDVCRGFYAHDLPQFPPKYRTRCSRRFPSGRLSRRGRIRAIKSLQASAYIYKTMSGRSGWPSRDPVEEDGGENLYSFVYGDSVNSFDELGLRRRSGNQNRNRDRGWNLDLFDARGQDILKWWLDGSGQRRDLSDGIWGDYMMANETLRQQLKNKMEQDAISRISSGAVNLQFHAEIENGYLTGYEMLHGTHRGVGDFTVKGNAGVSGTTCRTVDYKVTYVWHDIIDPNATYSSDNLAAWVLKLFYKPKDYEIHISWSQPSRVELSSKIINKETGYPFEKK